MEAAWNRSPFGPPVWAFIRSALDRPRSWLAAVLLLTAVAGAGVLRLELRTDGAAIYPAGDPAIRRTEQDRRAFNEPDRAIVLVTAKPGGPRLDSRQGLRFLKRLHGSLEDLPGVEGSRVRSVASLLDPLPGTPLVLVGKFLDEIPGGEEELRALVARMRESSLARGLFLSADGPSTGETAAALYVPAARFQSREDLVSELESWARREGSPGFELRLTGPVVAEVMLGRAVLSDLARLVPLMLAVIAGLLFLCLRSPGAVAVCLAEVLLVLVWTLGVMGWCGVPVTLVTTVLPVVLLSVAVTDEIHLLDRFRRHLTEQSSSGGEERGRGRRALEAALREVARPIVVTSLTTAVAFLSFLAATIAPVRHFGLFTSLGVLLAMGLSFTFVPALVLVLPRAWFRERGGRHRHALAAHERLALRRRAGGVPVAVLLLALGVPGLLRLFIQDSWIDNFDPDSALPAAERAFNQHFWGSYRFDVVLTSEQRGFFQGPQGVGLMERLEQTAEEAPRAGGVLSHLFAYESAARALEAEGPLSALTPERLAEIAADVGTIEPRIDLDHYLRYDGTAARLRIFVESPDYRRGRDLEDSLEEEIGAVVAGTGVDHHFSGDLPVADAVVRAVVTNMLRSVGWTVAGVGLLLAIALRSLRSAAVAMAPLVSGIPLLLGAMGYAGVPLGVATSLFVAVTIGVAVDFAVHLSHAYRSSRSLGMGHEPALAESLASAGRAIRWNAVVLTLGFSVLALSALKPNRSLGLLLAAAIVTCYATTLLLLPRLLETSHADQNQMG